MADLGGKHWIRHTLLYLTDRPDLLIYKYEMLIISLTIDSFLISIYQFALEEIKIFRKTLCRRLVEVLNNFTCNIKIYPTCWVSV
jgi:hypothetical protein